jgi:hypothetical protein
MPWRATPFPYSNIFGVAIDGFSVHEDSGATLGCVAIEERVEHVKGGDTIIAHMNKPAPGS